MSVMNGSIGVAGDECWHADCRKHPPRHVQLRCQRHHERRAFVDSPTRTVPFERTWLADRHVPASMCWTEQVLETGPVPHMRDHRIDGFLDRAAPGGYRCSA